jgi:hypothetical protein
MTKRELATHLCPSHSWVPEGRGPSHAKFPVQSGSKDLAGARDAVGSPIVRKRAVYRSLAHFHGILRIRFDLLNDVIAVAFLAEEPGLQPAKGRSRSQPKHWPSTPIVRAATILF